MQSAVSGLCAIAELGACDGMESWSGIVEWWAFIEMELWLGSNTAFGWWCGAGELSPILIFVFVLLHTPGSSFVWPECSSVAHAFGFLPLSGQSSALLPGSGSLLMHAPGSVLPECVSMQPHAPGVTSALMWPHGSGLGGAPDNLEFGLEGAATVRIWPHSLG